MGGECKRLVGLIDFPNLYHTLRNPVASSRRETVLGGSLSHLYHHCLPSDRVSPLIHWVKRIAIE